MARPVVVVHVVDATSPGVAVARHAAGWCGAVVLVSGAGGFAGELAAELRAPRVAVVVIDDQPSEADLDAVRDLAAEVV